MLNQLLYSFLLLPVFVAAVKITSIKNKKVRDTLSGHCGLWERLDHQLKSRHPKKPLIWFHVASAGEYLQALPVMERLMANNYQCAVTVTSISGYRWASKRISHYPDLVLLEYLPFDTKNNVNQLLDLINPAALVFVKFDLWPNLIWQTKKRNIPQLLISATLHEKSKRTTSSIARSFYRSIYQHIDQILTVTDDDKTRFLQSYPAHQHISTVGDTRFDSVLDRKKNLVPPRLPDFVKNKTVFILGSIWPADEHHIFDQIITALNKYQEILVIAAPHETDDAHIQAISKTFADFSPVLLSDIEQNFTEKNRVLIVNTVGQLSSLYTYADIAYVGGAFSSGVHNTMEPAAMGVATMFGPFFQNSPEAINMVESNTSFSIKDQIEFATLLNKLLDDNDFNKTTGQAAQDYIQSQSGASDRCFEKIKECIAC